MTPLLFSNVIEFKLYSALRHKAHIYTQLSVSLSIALGGSHDPPVDSYVHFMK